MLCTKLHCQQGFNLILPSDKTSEAARFRRNILAPDRRSGQRLGFTCTGKGESLLNLRRRTVNVRRPERARNEEGHLDRKTPKPSKPPRTLILRQVGISLAHEHRDPTFNLARSPHRSQWTQLEKLRPRPRASASLK